MELFIAQHSFETMPGQSGDAQTCVHPFLIEAASRLFYQSVLSGA